MELISELKRIIGGLRTDLGLNLELRINLGLNLEQGSRTAWGLACESRQQEVCWLPGPGPTPRAFLSFTPKSQFSVLGDRETFGDH